MPKSKCPTKWKRAMTEGEAKAHAAHLRHLPGGRQEYAYLCPEGHWHVGNREVGRRMRGTKGKRRRK